MNLRPTTNNLQQRRTSSPLFQGGDKRGGHDYHPQPLLLKEGRKNVGSRSLVVSFFGWLLVVSSLLLPSLASAQESIKIFKTPNSNLNFTVFADRLGGIANRIIPFLIGVALVAIIWGIFKYIQDAGDAEKVAEGRKVIIYGIIALFMMLSFWGFVMIIKNSLFG